MKALSIKQPWASLIAHGIKDIENRTWKTSFRGRIYIHASGKWDVRSNGNNPNDIFTWDQLKAIPDIVGSNFLDYGVIVKDHETPLSAIIGEIEIVDCVINHESIWAEKTEGVTVGNQFYYKKPIYNWVLANPVLYEEPIPAKGKLSFWEPDAQTLELIKNR